FHGLLPSYPACTTRLPHGAKNLWTSYIEFERNGTMKGLTWIEMERWLKDTVPTSTTRAYSSQQKLISLHQHQDQTYEQFMAVYENAEAEQDGRTPDFYAVQDIMSKLTPQLHERIVNQGIPVTRKELREKAQIAEMMNKTVRE